jgi:hypothetical protein
LGTRLWRINSWGVGGRKLRVCQLHSSTSSTDSKCQVRQYQLSQNLADTDCFGSSLVYKIRSADVNGLPVTWWRHTTLPDYVSEYYIRLDAFKRALVTTDTTCFHVQKFGILLTQSIYVFHKILGTKGDYFFEQHFCVVGMWCLNTIRCTSHVTLFPFHLNMARARVSDKRKRSGENIVKQLRTADKGLSYKLVVGQGAYNAQRKRK